MIFELEKGSSIALMPPMSAEAQIGTDLYGSNQSQIPTITWFVPSHSQHRPSA